jgi:hypothetical protein
MAGRTGYAADTDGREARVGPDRLRHDHGTGGSGVPLGSRGQEAPPETAGASAA